MGVPQRMEHYLRETPGHADVLPASRHIIGQQRLALLVGEHQAVRRGLAQAHLQPDLELLPSPRLGVAQRRAEAALCPYDRNFWATGRTSIMRLVGSSMPLRSFLTQTTP